MPKTKPTYSAEFRQQMALFTFIEGWYNPRRRHSALGYESPVRFEGMRADAFKQKRDPDLPGLPTGGAGVTGAAPSVDNPAMETIEIA